MKNYYPLKPISLSLCFLLCSLGLMAQNALDFDGSNDEVTVPNASALIANSNMTLAFWVYPVTNSTGWPDFDGYAGFRNDVSADFYVLQLGGNNIEARLRNSSGTVYTITYQNSLNQNAWNHFALTYNGSTLTLYHDGAYAASISASGFISSSTEAFNLGFTPFGGNNFYLKGKLDNLGLWNRALTSSEVGSLYTACGPDLADSTLQLSYDFNQGTAGGNNSSISTLIDGTGHINGNLANFNLSGNSSNFVSSPLQGTYTWNLTVNSCGPYRAPNGVLYSSSGSFSDTIIASSGCDTILNLNLSVSNLDSSAHRIANNKLEANETDTAAKFQWLNCNTNYSPIFGATGKQFTFIQNGAYAVEVTLNQCVDTSACITITNVGLVELEDLVKLYPNPAKDKIALSYPAGLFKSYSLMDLQGRIILEGELNVSGNESLKLSGQHAGLYYLSLKGDLGTSSHKIILEP